MEHQSSRSRFVPIIVSFRDAFRCALLAAVVWLAPPPASGQTIIGCKPLDCNAQFYVQIVPDPDYPNTAGCQPSSSTPCGGGDQFRQLFYKVQLVYIPLPPDVTTSFNLGYTELRVNVEASVENPVTGGGYSFINAKATRICHEAQAATNGWVTATDNGSGGWTNGVNFTADEKNADILFSNNALPCPEAAVIHFSPPSGNCPNNANICAIADLFRVVVNAYPGENVNLKATLATYNTFGEGVCLLDLGDADATATTLLPNISFNTPNDRVKVRLKNPLPISTGGYNVEVEVVNQNNFPIDIDYLEFVVKMEVNQAMTPQVTSNYDRPSLSNGMTHYIHFIVPDEGWTLAANGGTHSIGTIAIKPPLLGNATWDATLTLIDDTKSRIKTPSARTRLPFSDPIQSCQDDGDPLCSFDSEGVVFTVEGLAPDDCAPPFTKKIKVGFRDTDLGVPYIMVLKDLAFTLSFDITGDVQFVEANFPSNWTPACPPQSICLASPCYETSTSSSTIQFTYCVSIPNSVPNFIQISPEPQAFAEPVFEGGGCINSATVTSLSLRRNGDPSTCIPPYSQPPYTGIPVCQDEIYGIIATETGDGVEGVEIKLALDNDLPSGLSQPLGCDGGVCPDELFNGTSGTGGSGAYGFCPCEECRYFTVTPRKDNDHLNGVSTFDLVLISRHILGITPLGSPYKIIAADANKMSGVTTSDIVEIRKLILGIYNEFPNNTSWRFVDADFSFPNPSNPFQTQFPETRKQIDMDASQTNKVDFVAVKVGDVNNSAAPYRPSGNRPETALSWPAIQKKPGDAFTIPVVYTGEEPLEAFQAGLRFDPALLQLLSPSQGDLPAYNADCFGLTNVKSGEIRTLWLPHDPGNPDLRIEPGTVLFHLTFKVLSPLPESDLPLWLDDAVLPNAAWRPDGTECALVYVPSAPVERNEPGVTTPAALWAECRPNPSGGEVTLKVQSAKSGKGRIALFGPYGNRVFVRDVALDGGEQEFAVPEVAQLPAGVYIWKVYAHGEKTQGHLVKQ
ncbi:MAG: hypothetical protein OHK0019_05680 [Saprospiraceae bacterium]